MSQDEDNASLFDKEIYDEAYFKSHEQKLFAQLQHLIPAKFKFCQALLAYGHWEISYEGPCTENGDTSWSYTCKEDLSDASHEITTD